MSRYLVTRLLSAHLLSTRLLVVGLIVSLLLPSSSTMVAAAAPGPGAAPLGVRGLGVGSRVPWQGQNWYLMGANVPWVNWAKDFGGGPNGGGVSSPGSQAAVGDAFATAKANGANTIRWWVFEGDPWQIGRDGSGAPTSVNDAVYQDFDAAIQLAEANDLYLVFVLFGGPSQLPKAWLDDGGQRARLANALGPLFAHYKDNPRVLTWEVFNEPDVDVWGGKTNQESMRATVREVVNAIHANSTAYATVGMGMIDALSMVTGLGLDYYQAHWYPYMSQGDYCAICRNYDSVKAQHNLDAPLVIGELYLGTEVKDAHLQLDDLYTKGYAGAWPWSMFPDSTSDKLSVDWNSVRIFSGRHPDLGPRMTDALAPSDAPPTAQLVFTSKATVIPDRVGARDLVAIDADVTSTTGIKVLVDVEVYGPGGDKAFQKFWDNETFGPGETKRYTASMTVAPGTAVGEYTVKIGVFTPGWGKTYDWNDNAGKLTVVR
jgi:hypothetical protein